MNTEQNTDNEENGFFYNLSERLLITVISSCPPLSFFYVSVTAPVTTTSASVSMMCPQRRVSWWSWSADWGGRLPCRSCGTERTNKCWTPMISGYCARVSTLFVSGLESFDLDVTHKLDFMTLPELYEILSCSPQWKNRIPENIILWLKIQ